MGKNSTLPCPTYLMPARLYAIGLLLVCLFPTWAGAQPSSKPVRPRIVVMADPELDDNNSLIRFLLYSSDLQIEGLIYASSGYHWTGDGNQVVYSRKGIQPFWIDLMSV